MATENRPDQANRSGQENRPGQEKRSGQESQSGQKSFRCADLGQKDCNWEVKGRSEAELMPQIERHGREKHNIQNFDSETRKRVSNAIRDKAA